MVVNRLNGALLALSDPTRRAILVRLAHGPAPLVELAAPFRMTQQAISKHVACLVRARLVAKRRQGRRHLCTLRPEPLAEVADWVENCRRMWAESFDRLDEVLAEMKEEAANGRRR